VASYGVLECLLQTLQGLFFPKSISLFAVVRIPKKEMDIAPFYARTPSNLFRLFFNLSGILRSRHSSQELPDRYPTEPCDGPLISFPLVG
jgi:hypothetical protein